MLKQRLERLVEPIAPPTPAERFAALVQPHYEVLYRTAYRLTRSMHDAEDLAQEVCVRAFPRLPELEKLEEPRGWLMRVMYRLFVDWSRRYERTHVASMETVDVLSLATEDPGPAEVVELLLDGRHLDQRGSGSTPSSARCSRCTTSRAARSRSCIRSRESRKVHSNQNCIAPACASADT